MISLYFPWLTRSLTMWWRHHMESLGQSDAWTGSSIDATTVYFLQQISKWPSPHYYRGLSALEELRRTSKCGIGKPDQHRSVIMMRSGTGKQCRVRPHLLITSSLASWFVFMPSGFAQIKRPYKRIEDVLSCSPNKNNTAAIGWPVDLFWNLFVLVLKFWNAMYSLK